MRNKLDTKAQVLSQAVSLLLFVFFILAPVLEASLKAHVTTVLFLATLSIVLICLLRIRIINKYILLYAITTLVLTLFGCVIAKAHGINLEIATKSSLYYLKPVVFLFAGYFLFSSSSYRKLIVFANCYFILGTVLFYYSQGDLLNLAHERVFLLGIKVNEGYNFSTVPILGFVQRNTTLVLGALESSYALFFIVCYFFQHYLDFKRWQYLVFSILSIIMLILTVTRSSMIATAVAAFFLTSQRLKKGVSKRISAIALIVLVSATFLLLGNHVHEWLVVEGSATIHRENLIETTRKIVDNPFGTGLGTSGWKGATESPYYLYSEGSTLTTLIELGVQSLVLPALTLFICCKYSKKFLFPVFSGYFIASLLIPIGFSTLFLLLFYVMVGVLIKENCNGNSYTNPKLE